jgi:hypothetical protein
VSKTDLFVQLLWWHLAGTAVLGLGFGFWFGWVASTTFHRRWSLRERHEQGAQRQGAQSREQ